MTNSPAIERHVCESSLRSVALYLPQFHPIPENNDWWGPGFTEWSNVVKGTPRFPGHYQPHFPADLGFYDLRLSESRLAQEALARSFGIHGFCYYHYWFNGRRLLEEPLNRKMNNTEEDLPFMLCWANENWTRAWDGGEHRVLLKQEYNSEDDRLHIKHLFRYFEDSRYIRVNGKPFLIIYKPDVFPDIRRTLDIFRSEARSRGTELYIAWFERWNGWKLEEAQAFGFDAAIEFQPLSRSLRIYLNEKLPTRSMYRRIRDRLDRYGSQVQRRFRIKEHQSVKRDQIIDYSSFVQFDLARIARRELIYPGICPMWDNSSRRRATHATIFKGSTPEIFRTWYEGKRKAFLPPSMEENFIFVNAWNEWAEGNHLEPCERWGHRYLEALRPTTIADQWISPSRRSFT